jgi:NAD(P)-dependent dehydrogenase (short-subunit alcohol dehydrogenase family)
MYDLAGKVAIVTGAGSKRGFGRGIAHCLAREGADVVVIGRPSTIPRRDDPTGEWKGIDSVADEVKTLGRQALAITCDISQSDEVSRMVKEALDKFGQIDILVNNAAVHHRWIPIQDTTDEIWNETISINLTGAFFCSRAVAQEMIRRNKGGKIINISSIGGKRGSAGNAAYGPSKFGLIGLTQCTAHDLAPYHINVNAVCPASAQTDFSLSSFEELAKREGITVKEIEERYFSKLDAKFPLGRMITPDDLANMTAFLASKEADAITGQAINVCGGRLICH